MEFLHRDIQKYVEQFTSQETPLLNELNRYTNTNSLKPRMLSGHLQGKYLSMISNLMRPERILEIGTFTGYSALCLAEGLTKEGKLYTIDNNEEVMSVANTFIGKSEHSSKIITLLGDASLEIKALNEQVPSWDLIWIDADKSNYYTYYELCIDKLRPGGLIMADNVLWSGKVLDSTEIEKNTDTRALHEFNTRIQNDNRVENVLLPLRDGIMMIRKL